MPATAEMQRTIGFGGAAITLIGFVIGVSIFILPGTLAASTGPAVILSYLLASLLALFSCVAAAQIGSVFPVSGASFIAVSRLLGPFWGFVVVWLILGAASVAIALLGYGFADYMQLLWPSLDRKIAALLLVLVLGGINLLGIKDTVLFQGLLVGAFLLALAVFTTAGVVHLDTNLLSPFMPNGLSPVLIAAIPAFFSFAGFMMIIEIGGEIRNPSRNIPLALAVSFATVLVVYILVSFVIVGVIPWWELAGMTAPVGEAATRILPGWAATAITMTAVAAAASSVNAMLLGYSRDVLALARVQVAPRFLAKISATHGQPVNGVLLMTALSMVAVGFGGRIVDYATLVVIGLLAGQIAIGVALLRLPTQLAQLFGSSGFRLGRLALPFFSVGLIVLSLAFLAIAILDTPRNGVIALVYLLPGLAYYAARRRWLGKRGLNMEEVISQEVAAISRGDGQSGH